MMQVQHHQETEKSDHAAADSVVYPATTMRQAGSVIERNRRLDTGRGEDGSVQMVAQRSVKHGERNRQRNQSRSGPLLDTKGLTSVARR
jgi:hypothetical protein